MSFSVRAAGMAVMFAIIGITGVSAPGRAYNLDRPVITTSSIAAPNGAPATQTTDPIAPAVDAAAQPQDAGDAEGYATLEEAVAAQDMPDQLDGDLRCLAEAVYFEAKGEPLSGQLAVAKVILNRTQSGRFPSSVCSVITQSGQFSFVRGGALPPAPRIAGAFRTAVAIAQVAMNDDWDSAANNALYFHARRVAPGWRMTRVAAIGNHVFYR